MQSLDEQLKEIQKREKVVRKNRHNRRAVLFSCLFSAICICLIVAVAGSIPFMAEYTESNIPAYYGSALFGSHAARLVIIILLSFALGVSVALLCRALVKMKKGRKDK